MMTNEVQYVQPALDPLLDDQYTSFAKILTSIVTTFMSNPNSLETYLADNKRNPGLFEICFQVVNGPKITPMTEKLLNLKSLFCTSQITWTEFPAFVQLFLCKLEFRWLPFEDQLKIKAAQNAALSTICTFKVPGNRIMELSNFSQLMLEKF